MKSEQEKSLIMRKTAPGYKEIDTVHVSCPEFIRLDNGIPLYSLNAGAQDIIKISLLFDAGSLCQPAPLVAFAANKMLLEGSRNYSAAEISEINDFYGSYLTCSTDKDSAILTLLTLRKHLDKVLPVMEDLVKHPVYPDKELQAFVARHGQQFLVEEAKNKVIAKKRFLKALFGGQHPYGHELQLADFKNITVEQLVKFYAAHYHPSTCKIVVSGKVTDSDIQLINRHLGDSWQALSPQALPEYSFASANIFQERIRKEGAVQSSLRIGKQVCNKMHADYAGLTVLNTLLGGYFGSRLMRNIREEKGYTYGICSLLVSLRQAGYFSIAAEVGASVTEAALKEIYVEIDRLQQKLVPDDELQLVRTYLMSEMLRSFDGPFAQAESLIALLEYGQDAQYYEQYMHSVKTIDAQAIQRIAQEYMDTADIYETVVG
jgi:predicted Zn-dependent peptidase